MTTPSPIARLPTESAAAYQAFCCYAMFGPDRSIERLSQELAKSVPLLKRWSAANAWQIRAAAYDEHLAQQAAAAQAEAWSERAAQVRDRAWAKAEQLLHVADEMLGHTLFDVREEQQDVDGRTIAVTIIKPVRWQLRDVAVFVELADKLSRLSLGLPTAHSQLDIAPEALELMTEAELVTLKAQMRKAQKRI